MFYNNDSLTITKVLNIIIRSIYQNDNFQQNTLFLQQKTCFVLPKTLSLQKITHKKLPI